CRAPSDVESYRAVILLELETLLQELRRVELPRPWIVRPCLGALLGWPTALSFGGGGVAAFADLLRGDVGVATLDVEELNASLRFVDSALGSLDAAWNNYALNGPGRGNCALWTNTLARLGIASASAVGALSARLTLAGQIAESIRQDC